MTDYRLSETYDYDWVFCKDKDEVNRFVEFYKSKYPNSFIDIGDYDGGPYPLKVYYAGGGVCIQKGALSISGPYIHNALLRGFSVDKYIKNFRYLDRETEHYNRICRIKYKRFTLYETVKKFVKENNYNVLLHFPHSSLEIPQSCYDDCCRTKDEIDFLAKEMADINLPTLYEKWDFEKIEAKYSRLYVDVEKYQDDDKETMAKYGNGWIYEKDMYGNNLHMKNEKFVKEADKYYKQYHKNLTDACVRLSNDKPLIIFDMHSFSEQQANVFEKGPYPDFNIGFNKSDKNDDIITLVEEWIIGHELSFSENFPYSGSISIDESIKTKHKVYSIMIELNKRVYL